jgi:hypothetical protein
MPAKGEEGKMEVIASCESYPLPRSRPSLFPPFPNPPSLAAWRAAVNMGVTGRGAPGNWGDWGTRERERAGGGQRRQAAPGRSSRGWREQGKRKRRRGIRLCSKGSWIGCGQSCQFPPLPLAALHGLPLVL